MIDINKFIDRINAEVKDNTSCIISGVPSDYSEYKKKVGYGSGLEKAKEILKELLEAETNKED